jgi:hypothetical protein
LAPTWSGLGDAQALLQGGFVVWHRRHDLALGLAQLHVVVVARHGDAALVVLHGGQQRRQALRGVGRVVAVVAAVQRHLGAIDLDAGLGRAAVAEDQRGAVGGVHRSVVDHDGIRAQQLAVGCHHLADRGRAFFLFAVEHHLHVDAQRGTAGLQGVDGGEEHHDGRFVIRR